MGQKLDPTKLSDVVSIASPTIIQPKQVLYLPALSLASIFKSVVYSVCWLPVQHLFTCRFFLFTAGFRIYLRLWNRLFSSLRSNDSTWRKNVTWYWETMGLHMHEPQWSGVRRMTHFDRYEVVMHATKESKMRSRLT